MSEHTIYQIIVLLCSTQGVKSGIEHLPGCKPIYGCAAWILYCLIAAIWWVIMNSIKVEYTSMMMAWIVFFAVPGAYSLFAKFCKALKGK